MMHRREALGKLAAGGIVAAGAAAVHSAPAFAFAGPTLATGATLITNVVNDRRVSISITSVGTASCPGSALSTSAGTYVRSDLAEVSVPGPAFLERRAPGPTVPFPATATTLAFDVRKTNNSGPNAWVNGDQFTVTVLADFTCTYAGGSQTTRLSTVRTLTFNGAVPGDWIVT